MSHSWGFFLEGSWTGQTFISGFLLWDLQNVLDRPKFVGVLLSEGFERVQSLLVAYSFGAFVGRFLDRPEFISSLLLLLRMKLICISLLWALQKSHRQIGDFCLRSHVGPFARFPHRAV